MSITGELRKWNDEMTILPITRRQLLDAIADRIDIEHEKALRELNNLADAIADSFVQLPKDANGEYIHIGDMMEHVELGYVLEVIAVGVHCFIAWNTHLNRYCQYDNKLFRHHHEPTIEDVLAEFALEIDPSADIAVTGAETIKKFAAKLQLKETE